MLQSLSNPEPDPGGEPRNLWAVFDLIAFSVFALIAFVGLAFAFVRLPPIYAIPLQGVYDAVLVLFLAGWIRTVRRTSFAEYINFFRSHTFSTRSLIILGVTCYLLALPVSKYFPTSGDTPLEKLLTTKSAVLLFAVFGVTVAPLMEEIIFRGFLFKALAEIGGYKTAIPGSALLFTAPHLIQLGGNWGAGLLILVVGFVLAIVRYRSNSIIPSFIVHTSYNATIFALFAVGTLLQKSATS
jgi:membrane protease YdiL (CAAX protease family)